MKKTTIITALLLTIVLTIHAQAHPFISASAGASTSKSAIATLEFGIQTDHFYVGYDQRVNIDAINPLYIGGKIGYKIYAGDWDIIPVAGYYYRLVSSDDKSRNGHDYGFGIKAQKNVFIADIYHVGNEFQFSIGMTYKF